MHPCSARSLALVTVAALGALVASACTSSSRTTERGSIAESLQQYPERPAGDALRLRPPRTARSDRSEAASRAHEAFWDAFYGERYEAIPGVIRQLSAAFLADPQDAQTALLLAHTHLWRVSERERMSTRDPATVDHLVLAEHYFEEAMRLNPADDRIIGWLGSVRLSLGAVRRDEVISAEGARLLEESIRRYPQFNLFTAAFVRSQLPANDPRFREALHHVRRNIDACSGSASDTTRAAHVYQDAARADSACANSARAPHNFEGFLLNYGDMLVKSGDGATAAAVYARAQQAPTYADWPYRELLEERMRNAASAAVRARAGEPTPMMAGSAYSCAACHARR